MSNDRAYRYPTTCYLRWADDQAINSSDWTEVWSQTDDGILYEMLLVFNTANVDLKITTDTFKVMEFDLSELSSTFGLGATDQVGTFSLASYANNRWAFRPVTPLFWDSSISVEAKSQQGNRRVTAGISVVGVR